MFRMLSVYMCVCVCWGGEDCSCVQALCCTEHAVQFLKIHPLFVDFYFGGGCQIIVK